MKAIESQVEDLLAKMTLREKIGQMTLPSGPTDENKALVRQGLAGGMVNVSTPADTNEFQRLAVHESRLGIPLIIGRDVIHGFRTIFPIPLGQAASWNPDLVEAAARIAAREASKCGIRWTFSPMVDIARDPRWGRIAEGFGEDPVLAGTMGAAMVRGYQGEDMSHPESLAACAKHFVGYGAAEGGRDYNTTDISERTLRDVYLKPFKSCVDAGLATLMSAFQEIDGVPASGNAFTLRQVLRDEWQFGGFVVSDWDSVREMIMHGFCADNRHAAREGVLAGVNMELPGTCYLDHIESLVASGEVPISHIDESVRSILRLKIRLGLFENHEVSLSESNREVREEDTRLARQLARESCVLLKNAGGLLPLRKDIGSLAIIGPLADSPVDQMGCWVMDAKPEEVRTPIAAIRQIVNPSTRIRFVPALPEPRSMDTAGIAAAVQAATESDGVILFLGESQNLSGEARCRAFIDLPGAQQALLEAVHATGKPIVVVLMTGRPLTIPWLVDHVPALLMAWHPGTMGGPAIADLLFGDHSPSGKLPVSIPRTIGQVPLYYNHKNTGRPPLESVRAMPMGTPLNPVGFCSHYLDADETPQFPFGFGLSYTTVEYGNPHVDSEAGSFQVTAQVTNSGPSATCEVVQLYIRDLVGSVTRPVRELKGFRRVHLGPGETAAVTFTLCPADLAFHNRDGRYASEPGDFEVWIAGSSDSGITARFTLP